MKKIITALLITISCITPAMAHANGAGWFAGGALFGYLVTRPAPAYVIQQQPVYVQQPPQTIYVYPTRDPVVIVPQLGQHCELRSEMVNGQIVQGNFCYQR